MTDTLSFKRGDTAAVVRATLFSDDGSTVPVNLTGASIKFIMALLPLNPGVTKVNAVATILNAATGEVGYDWIAADVDTAGNYQAEFQVTYSDGKVQTFPRLGYLTIIVTEDLD